MLTNQEKFHKEADKNYWKAIAELIPNEVPSIEKKRGKKDQEKKPSILVIQGPKPGKPTDLARMRQILVKLKHTTPAHLKLTPPAAVSSSKDAEPAKPAAGVASTPEAVVAAWWFILPLYIRVLEHLLYLENMICLVNALWLNFKEFMGKGKQRIVPSV